VTADTLATAAAAEADGGEPPWRRALRGVLRRRAGVAGLAVVVLVVALALLAPLVSPYDPLATDWLQVRKAPSAAHWFGTDEIGRDVLARIVWGSRASLLAGLVSVSLALAIGVPLGLVSGYVGGVLDGTLMRLIDAMLAIPFLILAIALAAFLGPSLSNAMIAIGITATPIFVRLTRAQVMNVKVEDYVEAARAIGNPSWRIALFHILPNMEAGPLYKASLATDDRNGNLPTYSQWGIRNAADTNVKSYICPADPTQDDRWTQAATSYCYNGQVFFLSYPGGWGAGNLKYPAGITDGTTQTIFFTEKGVRAYGSGSQGWAPGGDMNYWPDWGPCVASSEGGQPTGTASFYQDNPKFGGSNGNIASTPHTGGIMAGMGEVSVRNVSRGVSGNTWWAAMTPSGNDALGSDW
jgi:peptide/nickel transport system permease protein